MPKITAGSNLYNADPPRQPGPGGRSYPAYGRECPPAALRPISSGYNTMMSTGYPTRSACLKCGPPTVAPYWSGGGMAGMGVGTTIAALLFTGIGGVIAAYMAPDGRRLVGALAGGILGWGTSYAVNEMTGSVGAAAVSQVPAGILAGMLARKL